MTVTFDAFVSSNELVALMTGVSLDGPPPVLIDRGTGVSARCSPTQIGGILGMVRELRDDARPEAVPWRDVLH